MANDNKSKTALVTGASSGFGLLASVRLAEAGYTVAATMRSPDERSSAKLLEAARRAGVAERLHVLRMDVTEESSIHQAVNETLTLTGKIDVLVNNAGIALGGMVEDLPMEAWRKQMETNFFGLVAVTKAVLPHMREQRAGKIIQISSVSGRVGFPGYGAYASSKFAVEGFSESLRLELLPFGIHVVLIEPGAYKTDIWGKGLAAMTAPPTSPYADMLEAVTAYSRRAAETAPDPDEVARAIVLAAQSPSPRLRYLMGQGSAAIQAGKALLPWKWFERLILRALRRK